jgi:hypothetical protein
MARVIGGVLGGMVGLGLFYVGYRFLGTGRR